MVSGVDVIVPTRNRPDDLRRLLDSLTVQDWTAFTVVVIDQSGDPEVNADSVRSLNDPRFVHVVTPSRGKSRALNEAISLQATADWCVFTDDDCEVEPNWLSTIVASVSRHPDAWIIFGQLDPIEHDPDAFFVPSIRFVRESVYESPPWRSPGLLGMGANMVVPRSTFEAVGLFDEDLGPGGVLFTGEECELTYRVLGARGSVVQDPSIRVLHWGARARADGAADLILTEGFFATMAGHGKHLRRGDIRTLSVVLTDVVWQFRLVTRSILRRRRPFHLRRCVVLVRGVWAGFWRGPAWPSLSPQEVVR